MYNDVDEADYGEMELQGGTGEDWRNDPSIWLMPSHVYVREGTPEYPRVGTTAWDDE